MGEMEGARPVWAMFAAIVAVIFGAMTLYSGGSVLFVDGEARAAAGNYVPFVLWFNFMAGFVYIAAGIGLFLWRIWGLLLAVALAAVTVLVFAAFGMHIMIGGAYETRTLGAMTLRSVVWLVIAGLAANAWKNMQRNG